MYLYLDETKKMITNQACFGGIITPHRPPFLEKIYTAYLKQYSIKESNHEVKSYEKKYEQAFIAMPDFFLQNGADIQYIGVQVEDYRDGVEELAMIINYMLQDVEYRQITVILDGTLYRHQGRYLHKTLLDAGTGYQALTFQNSKTNVGIKLADIFCGLLRKSFLYELKNNCLPSEKCIVLPRLWL